MRIQHNAATAWRRWRFLAVAALAALALAVALARPASAAAGVIHFQSEANVFAPVSNPCTGGAFLLTGVDHLVFELTLNDAGGFNAVVQQYGQLTGTDNQGNAYIGNLTDTSVVNGQVGLEQTRAFTLVAVSQGAAPNVTVRLTLHFTVNANGTVTALVTDVTTTCQG